MDKQQKKEELQSDSDVQRELAKATGTTPQTNPHVVEGQTFWFLTYILLLLAFAGLYFACRVGYLNIAGDYVPTIQRIAIGAIAIVLVLCIQRAVKVYLIRPVESNAARYNLNRVVRLLAALAIFFIALSVLFANWYTAVLSLGLISLVLGFALQTPITSFIGWIYILVKVPYQVGDRIKIGDSTGDVISVSYLDTALWEFGGELLSTANHPSGRVIKFPNSMVLDSVVYNYSWSLFPYVWSDLKVQIAYQSDLEFVAEVMRTAAEEEVGKAMIQRVDIYRELLEQTPVDEVEVNEHPVVVFRVSSNTWVEAIVRYLVEPKQAGSVKTRLIKKILKRLNEHPEKVMFPKGDNR